MLSSTSLFMGLYTSPTSNPTFPPTYTKCGFDSKTCPHMKGVILRGRLYDARCTLPITEENIQVLVEGWNEKITVKKDEIEGSVFCGFDDQLKGVEREGS